MEDVLLLTAGMLADDERVAAQVRRAVQVVRRRRVPGRLAAPVGAARPVARRPRRALRGRRPGPDDLLLRRRQRRLPARLPAASSPAPPRSSWSATTAPPPRSSPRPTPCSPARPAAGVELRAQRPAGPAVTLHAARPTRSPRPRPSPRRIAPAARRRAAASARSPCCSASTPSPRRFEEALAARGIPYVVRGAARFFDRPEVRAGGHPAPRRGPLRRRRRRTLADAGARRRSPAWAGRTEAPAARGQTRDRWESWQALVDQATEFAQTPGADARRLRRRPRPPRRRAARPGRRRRHPGHPPRRQGPGVGRRVPRAACRTARCRSPTPTRPAADRGGAPAALRRHDPRPRATSRSRGPRPATRAAAATAQALAVPRRRCCPTRRARRAAPAASRKVRAAAASAASRCRPAPEKKRGRCADCPASYDEELFERLREWRKERAGEESVPAFVVFTDATLQLIAEHKPRTPAGAAADQRHRPVEARAVRRGRPRRSSARPRAGSGNISRNTQ